jgi:hypothetical protein
MQPGCQYQKRKDTIRVVSTRNFIKHYNKLHKGIPTSFAKEKQLKKPEKEKEKDKPDFFRRYNTRTMSAAELFRKLVLDVIVSNNLPLSLVESSSFRKLIETLNP